MMKRRSKIKGRAENGSFVAMPKVILESEEYAALTAHELKLLIDVFAQFNGSNNGALSAAWTIMKKRGWHSPDTLSRALGGLLDKCFLIKTRQGGMHRRCSFYAVSWLAINECAGKIDMPPTKVAPGSWRKTPSEQFQPIAKPMEIRHVA